MFFCYRPAVVAGMLCTALAVVFICFGVLQDYEVCSGQRKFPEFSAHSYMTSLGTIMFVFMRIKVFISLINHIFIEHISWGLLFLLYNSHISFPLSTLYLCTRARFPISLSSLSRVEDPRPLHKCGVVVEDHYTTFSLKFRPWSSLLLK